MKPPPSLLTSTRSSTKMTGWFWGSEAKLEAFGPREGNWRQLGCWGLFAKRYTMQHCWVIFKINNQSTDYNSIKQIRHPNTRNISRIFWCRRIFTKTCPICSPSTHRLLSLKLVVSKWNFLWILAPPKLRWFYQKLILPCKWQVRGIAGWRGGNYWLKDKAKKNSPQMWSWNHQSGSIIQTHRDCHVNM